MASSYTPGPWEIDRDRAGFLLGVTPSRCAPGAAPVCYTPPIVANAEADARLIAAAPDFFAAAQSLLEAWDARTTVAQQIVTGKSDRDLQKQAADALEALRAAIAKATGPDQ
jgi:hypothetical protein